MYHELGRKKNCRFFMFLKVLRKIENIRGVGTEIFQGNFRNLMDYWNDLT